MLWLTPSNTQDSINTVFSGLVYICFCFHNFSSSRFLAIHISNSSYNISLGQLILYPIMSLPYPIVNAPYQIKHLSHYQLLNLQPYNQHFAICSSNQCAPSPTCNIQPSPHS
ncbi:hypothetical protein TNCV_3713181 [Trichonephila clavipes]|nr:hypothetical protein TNCV_3713181 [Trichonephila clavipes]